MRRATVTLADFTPAEIISIHALHEESDARSTYKAVTTCQISIHALHEESDASRSNWSAGSWNFNPRSP